MKQKTLENWAWVLLYGGLLLLSLGVFTHGRDAWLGGGLIAAGIVAAVSGVVSIYLRSRLKDDR